jgi:hypothetical protein
LSKAWFVDLLSSLIYMLICCLYEYVHIDNISVSYVLYQYFSITHDNVVTANFQQEFPQTSKFEIKFEWYQDIPYPEIKQAIVNISQSLNFEKATNTMYF